MERRHAFRVRPRIGERIRVVVVAPSDRLDAWLSDISVLGLRLTCWGTLGWHRRLGHLVALRLALPDGMAPLALGGRIVHVRSGSLSMQIGICFEADPEGLGAPDEGRLMAYVMRRQRESLQIRRDRFT